MHSKHLIRTPGIRFRSVSNWDSISRSELETKWVVAGSNINRISVFGRRTIKCALVHITRPLDSHSILALECSIYDIDSRCLLRVIAGCQVVVTEDHCYTIQRSRQTVKHFIFGAYCWRPAKTSDYLYNPCSIACFDYTTFSIIITYLLWFSRFYWNRYHIKLIGLIDLSSYVDYKA